MPLRLDRREAVHHGLGMTDSRLDTEIIIIGGGMAGLTLGHALAQAGVEAVVVDRAPPPEQLAEAHDGRASALAAATGAMLRALGLWPGLAEEACPILDIRVSDGPSRLFLHYDHRDLKGAAGGPEQPGPMGWIVENTAIRRALHGALEGAPAAGSRPAPRLLAPAIVADVERSATRALVTLADGRLLRGALVVSAEGRDSGLREAAGIRVSRHDYRQDGLVCTVTFPEPHNNVAHERFLPAGPFALLPMVGRPGAPNRASIVWTERRDLAAAAMALPDAAFSAAMSLRFGDSLGPLSLAGGRWRYPLGLQIAERLTDRRLALIGDAGHVIHPIAGQGLNLGLRDVAALAEVVIEAVRDGGDPGSPLVLERYERWRRADVLALAVVTDGLNRLFANDLWPLRLARGLGLAAVNRLPPLRRFFQRHAMGEVGALPRLLQGKPV
ncbi:MAG: UbiH/UbiF/VisC/COQ6 family ubiquinone biosynthesis hydroxylase [Thalassobaculales bacterium]